MQLNSLIRGALLLKLSFQKSGTGNLIPRQPPPSRGIKTQQQSSNSQLPKFASKLKIQGLAWLPNNSLKSFCPLSKWEITGGKQRELVWDQLLPSILSHSWEAKLELKVPQEREVFFGLMQISRLPQYQWIPFTEKTQKQLLVFKEKREKFWQSMIHLPIAP